MVYLLKLVGVFVIAMAVMGLFYSIEYRLGLFGASVDQSEPRTLSFVNDTDYYIQLYLEDGARTKLMISQMDSGRTGFTTWSVKDTRTFKAYNMASQLIACKKTSWEEMERTGWTLHFKEGDSCQ